MRFKIFMVWFIIVLFAGIVYAFTNSLDGSSNNEKPVQQNNNFSNPTQNPMKNKMEQPLNPKEHAGFDHSNSIYSNPETNDTRYNSNCQFGQCIPGGINQR